MQRARQVKSVDECLFQLCVCVSVGVEERDIFQQPSNNVKRKNKNIQVDRVGQNFTRQVLTVNSID